VVEAAANRVWARLSEAAGQLSGEPIRGCAGFQALLADYRAGVCRKGAPCWWRITCIRASPAGTSTKEKW